MTRTNPAESEALTDGVLVHIRSRYLGDQMPDRGEEHLFGYRVTITNQRDHAIQLLKRHWDIIDADGQSEVIDGVGVVGQQPSIEPGETYSYGSFCPLPTTWGTMEGHYQMRDLDSEELLTIGIARFHLFLPEEVPSPV